MKTKTKSVEILYLGILIPFFAGMTLLIVSCDLTDHLEEQPPHIMTAENLFQDAEGFESALNGLYSLTRAELTNARTGGGIVAFNAGTDCCVTNNDAGYMFATTLQNFGDVLGPSNQFVERVWVWAYEVVNTANNIIHHAEEAEDGVLSQDQRNRILADARAVRAWAYRHLTYSFGDVPLTLSPASGDAIRIDWERTPIQQVRQQMLDDWTFAQGIIPDEGTEVGRMTKGAIQNYIAELYLALDEPENALEWANQVIDNPAYELITQRYGVRASEPGNAYMDMFQAENIDRHNGNTEALWVHQNEFGVIGGETYEIVLRRKIKTRYDQWNVGGIVPLEPTYNRGGRSNSRMSATKWALTLFEEEDDRGSEHAIRYYYILQDEEGNAPQPADQLPPGYAYGDTLWLDISGDITPERRGRVNWPYHRKFDWALPDQPRIQGNQHSILYLRLAETYLLKAEAQLKLEDTPGAATTINEVRARSNASQISAGDVDLDFILDERSRELIYEEHRRYTLVRTGKMLERTRLHNNNGGQLIEDRHVLFPIPQSVIDANETEFPQNPGY